MAPRNWNYRTQEAHSLSDRYIDLRDKKREKLEKDRERATSDFARNPKTSLFLLLDVDHCLLARPSTETFSCGFPLYLRFFFFVVRMTSWITILLSTATAILLVTGFWVTTTLSAGVQDSSARPTTILYDSPGPLIASRVDHLDLDGLTIIPV